MQGFNSTVCLYEKIVELPTYRVGKPDKNPMFLEKRVYQGSSGKVYPLPVIDRIFDDKIIQKYRMLILENEYLEIWILPELGGRIQRAFDKTNGFDFVYYNQVVKPALVGLVGPWISGGIEFNWPQHHRPSTFSPVEYVLEEHEDGSRSAVVGEVDRMYGTRATTRFTLHPGKAYLQIDVRLYNGTPEAQTFLWWANPAFPANCNTQSVFPPDVHAVMDHGKRDVSKFPIADGIYYKVDYSNGVDISRFKNIPVPTSYMAYQSGFNFVGGYDHGKHAGLLHVADRHIAPGKKQWTWGNGDFGRAWDCNLTDEDGPYIELMTGVFTDNQPDFTWIKPYEEKTFTQFFMPYKELPAVKNATIDGAVNLEIIGNTASVMAYATAKRRNARIVLRGAKKTYIDATAPLSPEEVFRASSALDADEREDDLLLAVYSESGALLVEYRPLPAMECTLPEPAKAIPAPVELPDNEALYLAGMHLEQYRHATRNPEAYYLEGLRRNPGDIRINNAYGKLLLRRGLHQASEHCFHTAIATATRHNSNPYDCEPYYNLGLSLYFQEKFSEAYDAFYKSVWSAAQQDCGYFWLARLSAREGRWEQALEHIGRSLARNGASSKALCLRSALLRRMGRTAEALPTAQSALITDAMDFGAQYELVLALQESGLEQEAEHARASLEALMGDNQENFMTLALDYGNAGLYDEAIDVLLTLTQSLPQVRVSPMAYYYLGWFYVKDNKHEQAVQAFARAAAACSDYCFPNRQEDILALRCAQRQNPNDARSYYYLGNLWYDRLQVEEAIACWERSRELDEGFPTVHRNLALAYYNKLKDVTSARASLEKAFELNQTDARVLLELDQLYKRIGVLPLTRLENLRCHPELIDQRDDLAVEFVTLLNTCGMVNEAYEFIAGHRFHPWEGGEGKITRQYAYALMEIGKRHRQSGRLDAAIDTLRQAMVFPENLGEGKLFGAMENGIQYELGLAYRDAGLEADALKCLTAASQGLHEPTNAMFYNDQPPETIYYQGLALKAMGRSTESASRLDRLLSYGREHLQDRVEIDYFAVSLPDFLIFDDDLNLRNEVHCQFMMGLGHLGRGEYSAAVNRFNAVLALDASHQGALLNRDVALGEKHDS